jgi:hypothetical protein
MPCIIMQQPGGSSTNDQTFDHPTPDHQTIDDPTPHGGGTPLARRLCIDIKGRCVQFWWVAHHMSMPVSSCTFF